MTYYNKPLLVANTIRCLNRDIALAERVLSTFDDRELQWLCDLLIELNIAVVQTKQKTQQ